MLKVISSILWQVRQVLGKRMVSDALDDLRYSHYTLVARTAWSRSGRFYSPASGYRRDRIDYSVGTGPRGLGSERQEAVRLSSP